MKVISTVQPNCCDVNRVIFMYVLTGWGDSGLGECWDSLSDIMWDGKKKKQTEAK